MVINNKCDSNKYKQHKVGHKLYDGLLKKIIDEVSKNISREELISLCLEELMKISTGKAIIILEAEQYENESNGYYKLVPINQRGLNNKRWLDFKDYCKTKIADDLICGVIVENNTIDLWSSFYYEKEFDNLKNIFDIKKGGWLIGCQLPRGTARQNHKGIFIWYETGKDPSKVPLGAEQDMRFLSFFCLCYELASYEIRRSAKRIIMQRQELLKTLAPSILNHEIHSRVEQFSESLKAVDEELKILKTALNLDADRKAFLILEAIKEKVEKILIPHSEKLNDISQSVMGLTRRMLSGNVNPLTEINSAINLLQYRANNKGILLKVINISSDNEINIITDPALLMHVFVNLINNAIEAYEEMSKKHYTDVFEVVVEVRYDKNDETALPIVVDVIDYGKGISNVDIKRIFEPGVTTKKGGHGIGLAVSCMIVNYLGGELKVKNPINPTIFSISLPKESIRHSDLEEEIKNEIELI